MEDEEKPLRDWVGWEFLAAIALMAGGPIVGGLEKLLFIPPLLRTRLRTPSTSLVLS